MLKLTVLFGEVAEVLKGFTPDTPPLGAVSAYYNPLNRQTSLEFHCESQQVVQELVKSFPHFGQVLNIIESDLDASPAPMPSGDGAAPLVDPAGTVAPQFGSRYRQYGASSNADSGEVRSPSSESGESRPTPPPLMTVGELIDELLGIPADTAVKIRGLVPGAAQELAGVTVSDAVYLEPLPDKAAYLPEPADPVTLTELPADLPELPAAVETEESTRG